MLAIGELFIRALSACFIVRRRRVLSRPMVERFARRRRALCPGAKRRADCRPKAEKLLPASSWDLGPRQEVRRPPQPLVHIYTKQNCRHWQDNTDENTHVHVDRIGVALRRFFFKVFV